MKSAADTAMMPNTPAPAATWAPPARFDGYEVERLLGAGGMGVVYQARDVAHDRPIAIKVLEASDPTGHATARFALEVRALARARHRNIAELIQIGVVDGHPYFVQELLGGERLDQLETPMQWRRALAIGRGLARAIAAVHAHHILHRDIKPNNVMISGHARVKLFDFGLAKLLDAGGDDALPPSFARGSNERITEVGSVAGTPAYVAPEVWTGDDASVRSDLYAFGLVLYELLTGALPHDGLRGFALVQAILHQDARGLAARRPDVPPALAALVERCIARDPSRRPASADDVIAELDAILI